MIVGFRICKVCGKHLTDADFYGKNLTCKRCICQRNTLRAIERNSVPDLPGEIWAPVVGYENHYVVSNKGRVKGIGKKSKYRILVPMIHQQGYERVRLSVSGKHRFFLIHRLVAEAFIFNPDQKATVNHIDGNKRNNCVENLEWATQSENNLHAHRTGLASTTERQIKSSCLRAKITKQQVEDIIKLHKQAYSLLDLSKLYQISKSQVCRIVNGKSRQSTLKHL